MNNNLIIGLPGRHAQTKNGGRLVCATQRQNGGRIRFWDGPVRELIEKFKTCNEMNKRN